jgi:8-oxo-dGTP pyrophosphatase MutT (NUDIX family)
MSVGTASNIRMAATVILLRRKAPTTVEAAVSSVLPTSPPAPASSPPLDYDVLFVKRSSKATFMNNHLVFPGGILDDADHLAGTSASTSLSSSSLSSTSPLSAGAPFPLKEACGETGALRCAAMRELFEETGLLLSPSSTTSSSSSLSKSSPRASMVTTSVLFDKLSERESARDASHGDAATFFATCRRQGVPFTGVWPSTVERLAPWALWLTPTVERRRYTTWFYIVVLDANTAVAAATCVSTTGGGDATLGVTPDAAGEVSAALWRSPADVLADADAGSVQLAPPTQYVLTELMHDFPTVDAVLNGAQRRRIVRCFPQFTSTAPPTVVFPGDADFDVAGDDNDIAAAHGEVTTRPHVDMLSGAALPGARHRATRIDETRWQLQNTTGSWHFQSPTVARAAPSASCAKTERSMHSKL